MFHKLRLKDREAVSRPDESEEERLTRFGPDEERPECASHLTRFSQRHIREGAAQRARHDSQPLAQQTASAAEPVQGPDYDLYSDQPITINVLMRALPNRFAEAQADIADAFKSTKAPGKHA